MSLARGSAALSLLISATIILLLVLVFAFGGLLLGPSLSDDGETGVNIAKTEQADRGGTIYGQVKENARDALCRQQLQQIRAALQTAVGEDGAPVTELEQLGLPPAALRCPVSGRPYVLGPDGRTVRCDHPGHEGY